MDNFDAPDPTVDAAANPAEVPPETANAIDNALAWSDPTANASGGGLFPDITPLVDAGSPVPQMAQGIQDIFGQAAGQDQSGQADQVLREMNAALDSDSDTELRSQLQDALGSMTGGGAMDEADPVPTTDWQNAGANMPPAETTPWFGSGGAVPQDTGEDAAPAPADEDLND